MIKPFSNQSCQIPVVPPSDLLTPAGLISDCILQTNWLNVFSLKITRAGSRDYTKPREPNQSYKQNPKPGRCKGLMEIWEWHWLSEPVRWVAAVKCRSGTRMSRERKECAVMEQRMQKALKTLPSRILCEVLWRVKMTAQVNDRPSR